jgi:hypothetical protein
VGDSQDGRDRRPKRHRAKGDGSGFKGLGYESRKT